MKFLFFLRDHYRVYYNDFHIFCYSKELKNKITIVSISFILENKHYKCREFIKKGQKIIFGINIHNSKQKTKETIKFFSTINNKFFSYLKLFDKNLNCLYINNEYKNLIKEINENKKKNLNYLNLKESYIQNPYCSTKYNVNINNNEWYFHNFYNEYFCYCIGKICLYNKVPQKCKYDLYLNIIDINKNLYNKTDFILCDFIYKELSSDDAFPIFEEMINQNFSAYYLTQKKDIYKKYCGLNKNCLKVILLDENDFIINGDFLEKYLSLFLKLKAAITGAEFYFINNLFYNIDYITYINVGHGISFFKHYLYANNSYYGHKIYNKILIPPSKKLISSAKNYGWTDENIIKINLPKWDKYDNFNGALNFNKSILIMFTWRVFKNDKQICSDYFGNIIKLINNDILNESLKINNITLYFSLHHKILNYKNKFKINKNIKYINENEISNILKTTSLIVTDFSSIIFDIIYRNLPYIIFIPESNQTEIEINYTEEYQKIINDLKKGYFQFENIFLNINETINKIIYYINNNFKLDDKLKKFYENFGFKHENNIKKFIK